MINPRRSIPYDSRKRSSMLWVRLSAVFGVSFMLFFALFFAYDLLSGFGEKSALAATVTGRPAPIVIDPKIADQLAKVLAQNEPGDAFEVNDPFVDRAGLTGTPGIITTGGGAQTAGGSTASKAGATTRVQTVAGMNNVTQPLPPLVATKQRYEAWLGRSASDADLPLDARLFAIDDLLPVGIVDGGTGGQEIMFMSEAAGRTLSFPVGTMFFDGWLSEVRPEGVVFNFNDGRGTVRMRSWAHSLRTTN